MEKLLALIEYNTKNRPNKSPFPLHYSLSNSKNTTPKAASLREKRQLSNPNAFSLRQLRRSKLRINSNSKNDSKNNNYTLNLEKKIRRKTSLNKFKLKSRNNSKDLKKLKDSNSRLDISNQFFKIKKDSSNFGATKLKRSGNILFQKVLSKKLDFRKQTIETSPTRNCTLMTQVVNIFDKSCPEELQIDWNNSQNYENSLISETIKFNRLLGAGSFSKVYSATDLRMPQAPQLAIKVILKEKGLKKPSLQVLIQREVLILNYVAHVNLPRLKLFLQDKKRVYI